MIKFFCKVKRELREKEVRVLTELREKELRVLRELKEKELKEKELREKELRVLRELREKERLGGQYAYMNKILINDALKTIPYKEGSSRLDHHDFVGHVQRSLISQGFSQHMLDDISNGLTMEDTKVKLKELYSSYLSVWYGIPTQEKEK